MNKIFIKSTIITIIFSIPTFSSQRELSNEEKIAIEDTLLEELENRQIRFYQRHDRETANRNFLNYLIQLNSTSTNEQEVARLKEIFELWYVKKNRSKAYAMMSQEIEQNNHAARLFRDLLLSFPTTEDRIFFLSLESAEQCWENTILSSQGHNQCFPALTSAHRAIIAKYEDQLYKATSTIPPNTKSDLKILLQLAEQRKLAARKFNFWLFQLAELGDPVAHWILFQESDNYKENSYWGIDALTYVDRQLFESNSQNSNDYLPILFHYLKKMEKASIAYTKEAAKEIIYGNNYNSLHQVGSTMLKFANSNYFNPDKGIIILTDLAQKNDIASLDTLAFYFADRGELDKANLLLDMAIQRGVEEAIEIKRAILKTYDK